jgi:hypothetical protein
MMNNSSEFSQEEIRAELQRRGAIPADSGAQAQPQFTREEIRAELQRRGAIPEEGFIEKAKSFLGGAAHSLLGQLAPAQEFSQQAFKQSPEAFGMRAPPQVTDIPIGRPDTSAYKLGEITAEWGPLAVGGAGLGIKGATAIGKRLLGKNINRLLGREVNKADAAYKSAAHDIYSDLYDTPNYVNTKMGKENEMIGQDIKDIFDYQKSIDTKNYTDILKSKGNKEIKAGKLVNKILEDPRFETIFPKMGAVDKQAGKYLENPTLENAHWLQSKIGKRIEQEFGKKDSDYDAIEYMKDIRKNLVNKINKSAGKDYAAASKFHFKNIVPFTEDRAINNLVLKGKTTANFANKLSKGELDSAPVATTNTIARHMSPEQKEKVLLPFLKGTPNNPGVTDAGEINPEVMRKAYQGLHIRGLRPFMTGQTKVYSDRLNMLAKKLEKEKRLQTRLRYGAGVLGTSLGLGEIGRRIF